MPKDSADHIVCGVFKLSEKIAVDNACNSAEYQIKQEAYLSLNRSAEQPFI